MHPTRKQRQNALSNQQIRLDKRLKYLESLSRRFFWYRLLAVLLAGVTILVAISWFRGGGIYISLALSIGIFSVIVYYHRRIDRWIRKYQIWNLIKSNQLARMQLDWDHIPPSPSQSQLPPQNPIVIDLELIGNYSLHQLVDRTISFEGSVLLSDWLSQSEPNPDHINKYQKIIRDLVPLSIFRDKLTLNFFLTSKKQLEGKRLLKWLTMPYPSKQNKRLLPISIILVLLNITLFLLNIFGFTPPYWIITFLLYAVFYFSNLKILQPFLDAVVIFDAELDKFKSILVYLESYHYGEKKALAQLCSPFNDTTNSPSKMLRKIKWVTAAIGIRSNPVLMLLLNIIFPWDFYFSWMISHYQKDLSIQMPIWLKTFQELEASISLANFAYINPDYTFPEFIHSADYSLGPILEAKDLGHPLILPKQKICNRFSINNLGEVYIITGSNMAGKSTFVKTIGINLALAYAGGPVNASIFNTYLFRLHTCIKISDSIADGFSYFYAEVKCLKSLLDRINSDHPYPVLYLIDEIFRGTNNRERLIGSQTYIQKIAGKRSIGLIATHDLELANLEKKNDFITNYHFRDEVRDGKLVFDYKIRLGPSPTTNALKIMEMEGLPVDK
jgi:hypothetical protein